VTPNLAQDGQPCCVARAPVANEGSMMWRIPEIANFTQFAPNGKEIPIYTQFHPFDSQFCQTARMKSHRLKVEDRQGFPKEASAGSACPNAIGVKSNPPRGNDS
jgi:hypothetical protein